MNTPMDMLTAMDARQQAWAAQAQAQIEQIREATRLRSIKYIRLPLLIAAGFTTGSTVGGDTGQEGQSPDTGWVWHIRHMVIEGLATGATPDVVNILSRGRIQWQLNGNQFAQTWGRGEFRINQGETLAYAAVGTIASKTIIVHGTAEEVAASEEGKFR